MKAALARQIAEAVLGLSRTGASDRAIHATRKKLKSVRAKLRLLRDAVSRSAYAREDADLRDAARPLSDVRDAKVMLDTVNALLARRGTRARRLLLTGLRGRLRAQHAQARARFESQKRGAASASALERTARRIARWDVSPQGRDALARSVGRIYRKARKALAAADAQRSPESLHELRKQVKYLREALSALAGTHPRRNAKMVKRADDVASVLGEDHDLFVLQESLEATEASLHAHSESFADEVARRRSKLERRALDRAGKLLRRKPRLFVKRLAIASA